MSSPTTDHRHISNSDSEAESETSQTMAAFEKELESSIETAQSVATVEDDDGSELSDLQVMYNRRPYTVPKSAIRRDHGVPMRVKDGTKIGEMISTLNSAGKWPKASEVDLACIVVLSSTETSDDGEESTNFNWYTRIVCAKEINTDDCKILRHIPRPLVRNILNLMSSDLVMRNSSLLQSFQPKNDNFKPLQPKLMSGWKHCKTLLSSSSISAPRKPKASTSTGRREPQNEPPKKSDEEEQNPVLPSEVDLQQPQTNSTVSPDDTRELGVKIAVAHLKKTKKRKTEDTTERCPKAPKNQSIAREPSETDRCGVLAPLRVPDAPAAEKSRKGGGAPSGSKHVTFCDDGGNMGASSTNPEHPPTPEPVEAIYFFQSDDSNTDDPKPPRLGSYNLNIPIPGWAVAWKVKLEVTSSVV